MSDWKFSADTGGTFTDCIAESPEGLIHRRKVLSSGRLRTTIGSVDTGKAISAQLNLPGQKFLIGQPAWIRGLPAGNIVDISAGQIVLSDPPNAIQAGDLLEIDSGLEAPVLAMKLILAENHLEQSPLSFRLGTTKGTNALLEKKGAPVALFLTEGFRDLMVIRDQKRPALFDQEVRRESPLYNQVYAIAGRMDTGGREMIPLDTEALLKAAKEALSKGCTAAAICFLNSWKNPAHEKQAIEILSHSGFTVVDASSLVRPLIKYLDRADTVLVNATLSPVMDAYLNNVEGGIFGQPLWIMTSAGGLVSRDRFHAVDSLVSGPAGGVLGAVAAGQRAGMDRIITLDMGGTSTDVSRWKEQIDMRQNVQVGHARILTPAMPIETVAAGGGSICGFRDGRLFVGPESAGADPGPASYGAGGPLCLTDIHLLLGRIDVEAFSIPIRMEDARARLQEVMDAAGETDWKALAEGFLTIATERMAHAIRQVTLRDGEDPPDYGLVAFGGAGGLHACRVAQQLGIKKILFPADAGLLSARGIHYAPREAVFEQQLFATLTSAREQLQNSFEGLQEQATAALESDGVAKSNMCRPECTVFLRITGQEAGVPVRWNEEADLSTAFKKRFVATFGYFPKNIELEVIKLRLRILENRQSANMERFSGEANRGPSILSDAFGTCFVEPGWCATSGDHGGILLEHEELIHEQTDALLENVRKTLVMNRLEGLVEEMGDQLQRTALSTNIRERLDFSCALMDGRGRLLVNAPHIPVHLGAMGLCVRECLKLLEIGPGDVVITNHPAFGGSHLPDVTLISGLFDENGNCVGYLANRAHHAELGGTSPGSMPADAKSLMEEGVILRPQYLLKSGESQFDTVMDVLASPPFPSRSQRENKIDLEAQLAALEKGRHLFDSLLEDFGSAAIQSYFISFYEAAAEASSISLAAMGAITGEAREELDDGHQISVRLISGEQGLLIDFSGTSPKHPGNLNATPAIIQSAVLYVLRLLVDNTMPLNEGLMDRVSLVLPECFLNPDFPDDPAKCPAVVGGNVETSQRVVDALIQAFGLMAAGQGSMNNFLFGNKSFGYYETIGGGGGAGEGFDGSSGMHVHMTNTAITDPEILEQRFPVICHEFSLRKNSGGKGQYTGGDGLVREISFKEAMTVSLLTQNRRKGARGMNGGKDGKPGCQWHLLEDGRRLHLEGITRVDLKPGEGIRIETPGGGGWGSGS